MTVAAPQPSPHAAAASLTLDCGGATLALVGDDRWLALVRRAYGGFATERPASFTIQLGTPAGGSCGPSGAPSRAHAAVAGRPRLIGLHPVLRQLYPVIVDGLVFHAAVLVFGEEGYLCCGHSGAGKSTLARLCPEAMRSDELGAVRRTPAGIVVASLPYHGGRRCQARLAGVMLLRHGERDERQSVGRSAALGLLTRHVFWPQERGALAAGFALLADVAESVPVSWLTFRPTPAVARQFEPPRSDPT